MKSEKIQLEIIKWLKLYPTHAYQLFQILEKEGIANRSSDVYRIIKTMKQNDLIAPRATMQSDAREILQLTGKGESMYSAYFLSLIDLSGELIENGKLARLQEALCT
jgi:DNA-binding PadR family transcriptional regulator